MFDSCICVDPEEVVALLNRRRPVAREVHVCGECRCVIYPGERYEVDTTLFDGDITRFKTCLTCVRIRESLFECGWYYGGIWADIHEVHCDNEDCICPTRGGR